MKRTCLFYFFIVASLLPEADYGQAVCGFDQIHQQRLATDPNYRKYVQSFELNLKKLSAGGARVNDFTDTIPIVVHVINTGDSIGSKFNPTDAQIQAAIDYTNQIYAGTWPGVEGAGDIGIRFVLAKQDPNCKPTNGIDRVDGRVLPLYETNGISYEGDENLGVSTNQLKKLASWNPNRYYNIWMVNSISTRQFYNALAAYAYFPTTADQDGIVIRAEYMFSGGTTLPHELGHAFFLYHTFEGSNRAVCPINNDCNNEGDQICDTDPVTQFYGAARTGINSCSNTAYSGNTEKNFMSYNCCLTLFTEDQKERMQLTAMTNSVRDTLRKSTARFAADNANSCSFSLHLDGKLMDRDIVLYWQGDDYPNSYELQRSYDGVNFDFVSRVPNLLSIKDYSYHDREIPQQKDYYRIRQFADFGVVNYSNVVEIDLPITNDKSIHILNNPVTSSIDMEIGFFRDNGGSILPDYHSTASIRLIDMWGREIVHQEQQITINQRLRVPVSNLPAGIYTLQVIIDNVAYIKKVLKL